ncbi:hypothetical protein C3920_00085 [Novacetimonas pomaceti]|uniref:Uncharacterized protein n=1 Tax=Novacetimonas pomaceti TaxID=2021998 RepID=A0ABX5P8T9_9PROT|nr:hypothetical protein C3920_00085 [Novacetimonas pomaceti]
MVVGAMVAGVRIWAAGGTSHTLPAVPARAFADGHGMAIAPAHIRPSAATSRLEPVPFAMGADMWRNMSRKNGKGFGVACI